MNIKLKKIFEEKLKKNYKNLITEGMLGNIKIMKYEYDSILDVVNIYLKPELKYILFLNFKKHLQLDLTEIINPYAWNIKYDLEDGGQHWLDGDAVYIENGEYDNNEYIIFANLYSCKLYYENESKIIGYDCNSLSNSNFDVKCKFFSS